MSPLIWLGRQRHSSLLPAGGASLSSLKGKTKNGLQGGEGGRLDDEEYENDNNDDDEDVPGVDLFHRLS